jgi:hypothetical protein
MNKIHYQGDQEELFKQCGGQMNMLIDETTSSLEKKAASQVFGNNIIEQYKPDGDHFLQHLVAMGSEEAFGPNRNGDGWPAEMLAKRSNTFVTHGHYYREHRNRDPKTQSIGSIKAAVFWPEMQRTELLVWGNKKKAEEEYEMAKKGKELSYSMSCRVPDDVCSCCGNRAKNASHYCDHLKYNMLQYLPEFEKYAYASNPNGTFFDISRVRKPADRIAHYLEFRFGDDQNQKAASSNQVILGTEWAEYEGVYIPEDSKPSMSIELGKIASALAGVEKRFNQPEEGWLKAAQYVGEVFAENATPTQLEQLKSLHPGVMMRTLAKKGCVLNFPTFAAYALDAKSVEDAMDQPRYKEARASLPSVFTYVSKQGCDMMDMFEPASDFTMGCEGNDDIVDKFMEEMSEKFSLKTEPLERRVTMIVIKKASTQSPLETDVKQASEPNALAVAYAAYQLQQLNAIKTANVIDLNALALNSVVAHNRSLYR